MNALLIFFLAVFFISVAIGYWKGFLKTVFSMLNLVIAVALAAFLNPYVTSFLMTNTTLYQQTQTVIETTIDQQIQTVIEDTIDQQIESSAEEIPSGIISSEGILNEIMENKDVQEAVIKELSPIQAIQDLMEENNTEDVYEQLGVQNFSAYVGAYLAHLIIQAIAAVITFLVVIILLQILQIILDLIGCLPVFGSINRLAGAVLGIARGILIIWIFCLIIMAMSGTETGQLLLNMVEESTLLKDIYQNNLLLQLFLELGIQI